MVMLAVMAVAAAVTAAAGIRENLMVATVLMQLLSGVLRRREGCHGIRHVFARAAAALAVPGAAAAVGKVRSVRVEGRRRRRGRGRHLEK